MPNRKERRKNKSGVPGDVSIPREAFNSLLVVTDIMANQLEHTVPSWEVESERKDVQDTVDTYRTFASQLRFII